MYGCNFLKILLMNPFKNTDSVYFLKFLLAYINVFC